MIDHLGSPARLPRFRGVCTFTTFRSRAHELSGLIKSRRTVVTDRIAYPWGARTPFPRDGEWPARVDWYLEDGVSEEEVDRWVRSASLLHSNGDALDIAVKEGRIVGVRGRAVDRVNRGRLEASWDEAMDRIVARSKALFRGKGPLSMGFYTSGQLFLEEYYALGVIGKAGLG